MRIFRKAALDALHAPHVSVLQRHVRARDLDSVDAAVQRVFETESLTALQLKTTGYYYIPFSEQGADGIGRNCHRADSGAATLAAEGIDAVAPFSESGGTPAAYITAPENARVLKQLIDYVDSYVPKQSGKNFNPHVTVGVGREEFLKQLKAEPFDVFTFKADGVAVYQLGDFGTAAKKLWSWTPKR